MFKSTSLWSIEFIGNSLGTLETTRFLLSKLYRSNLNSKILEFVSDISIISNNIQSWFYSIMKILTSILVTNSTIFVANYLNSLLSNRTATPRHRHQYYHGHMNSFEGHQRRRVYTADEKFWLRSKWIISNRMHLLVVQYVLGESVRLSTIPKTYLSFEVKHEYTCNHFTLLRYHFVFISLSTFFSLEYEYAWACRWNTRETRTGFWIVVSRLYQEGHHIQ